jgi:hypothetical protein
MPDLVTDGKPILNNHATQYDNLHECQPQIIFLYYFFSLKHALSLYKINKSGYFYPAFIYICFLNSGVKYSP